MFFYLINVRNFISFISGNVMLIVNSISEREIIKLKFMK
jgi:hypothetical protein